MNKRTRECQLLLHTSRQFACLAVLEWFYLPIDVFHEVIVFLDRCPEYGGEKVGENCYQTTLNSGDFDGIGVEISGDGSSIASGQLEMSNVDLSSQFTDMIVTQRGFQANSRVITTSDTLLEELINLKR